MVLVCINVVLCKTIIDKKIHNDRSVSETSSNSTRCLSDRPLTMLMLLNIGDFLEWINPLAFLIETFWAVNRGTLFDYSNDFYLNLLMLISIVANCFNPVVYLIFHTEFRSTTRAILKKVSVLILYFILFIFF